MPAPRLLNSRALIVALSVVLFEALRCGVPLVVAAVAPFPPAINISEGKTAQGFPYMSGGVGSSERAVMEEKGKAYNLKLAFAERRGSYLADVLLVIENAKGAELLSATAEGPWFFVQLPSGSYTIKAIYKGDTKQIKNLQIAKDKSVKRTLIWDLGVQSPAGS
jgi:hypothetical protein